MEGYTPKPINTGDVELPEDLKPLTEIMARNVHEVWAANRMREGWRYGDRIDEDAKTHPCLIDYDLLSESEKDYDRFTSIETIKLILKSGFKIEKNN